MKKTLPHIELEFIDNTAYVLLSREEKCNALNIDLLQSLVDAAKIIKRNKQIRAVIIHGQGGNFSSGLDIKGVMSGSRWRLIRAVLKFIKPANLFQQCALEWRQLPVPVIAVVEGYCFGGGLQIAMAADLRIAHPHSQLSIMETKWGLIPDMSGYISFPEHMRIDHAKLLTMSADIIDAQQAQNYGLITLISEQPMAEAKLWVEKFNQRSPDSLAAAKRLFHTVWNNSSPRRKLFWETWLQFKLLMGRNQRIAVRKETTGKGEYLPRK